MADVFRFNVTLDAQHAGLLSELAAETHLSEGTLARSLLSTAIDAAPAPRSTRSVVELLNAIPGALERARLGSEQGRRGEGIPLSDW